MNPIYIALDEEGYFISHDGLRIQDQSYGQTLLKNLKIEDHLFFTEYDNKKILIEAFDEPFVARHVQKNAPDSKLWRATLSYEHTINFDPQTLSLDAWDRFHARTADHIPIVFSRQGQMELFDLFDEFDDDSITIDGKQIKLPSHLPARDEVSESEFWGSKYSDWQKGGDSPGWELGQHVPTLEKILPQLKIPKSRIAVLGCGSGHDANYFYELGHIVTGIDFSNEALQKARELYPENDRRKFLQMDALQIPDSYKGQFDIVFEHTFYCAINPSKRDQAVQSHAQLLNEGGHLLGIFMIVDKMSGPPFGATEWELRARLNSRFEALYWTRWRHSIAKRLGRELVVYAQKKRRLQ